MATGRPPWWGYALWLCAGILLGFGYAGMASIGIFLIGLALIVILAGVSLPGARNTSVLALVAGLGAAPLFIAWNNLGGPGTVCRTRSTQTSCHELWSPWPFLLLGVALVAAGVGLALWIGRSSQRTLGS